MNGKKKDPCCPKCKSECGYSYDMTETHRMGGTWGEMAEAGDSGFKVKQGLVQCDVCKAKFTWASLKRKGLVDGLVGRR